MKKEHKIQLQIIGEKIENPAIIQTIFEGKLNQERIQMSIYSTDIRQKSLQFNSLANGAKILLLHIYANTKSH